MNTIRQTSKEYFRSLKIIHFALAAGQVIFGIIAFVVGTMDGNTIADEFMTQVFFIIVPVFMIGAFIASNILFKNRIDTAKGKSNLIGKMTDYRGAIIIKLAPLEGGSLFAIVAYFITTNIVFLALSALIVVVFMLNQPTKEKTISDLELNYDEEKELNNPDTIIAEVISQN